MTAPARKEEEPFAYGVAEDVKHGSRMASRRKLSITAVPAATLLGNSDMTEHYVAHVGDAGVGDKPFNVCFHQRYERAEERGDYSEYC